MTLDELLLPGTPDSVAARYHSLASRAETASFGLLEQDVVVLDTETTGLSFKTSELTEIAAARLNGREVVDTFRTFVHPGRPIPPEIMRLTGITNADVASAPRPGEAVAQLAEFVDGSMIVAHNASFDRGFIERARPQGPVTDLWVDSLALSRIALPCLSNHRLSDMASAFGQAGVSHRALDDVMALCGMWRIFLTALTDLPHGLLSALADMHPQVKWAYRPIFSQLALAEAGTTLDLRHERRELVSGAVREARPDPAEDLRLLHAPTLEQIADDFSATGLVSQLYDAFEARPEQAEMAEEVRAALESSTHRAIEAGTGVGKSMAYLIPLVRFAQANNITVGVATKTNALTDQLVAHELPALARTMPGGVTFTSLKGYDHYPCLRRLEQARHMGELPIELADDHGRHRTDSAIAADMLSAIASTYTYVCQYPAGDIDSLGIRWRSVPRKLLTCNSVECTRTRCPYFPDLCPVHAARKLASASDVVVTNHSLLLRNVSAEGKVLPPIRHWVVDEAHAFEAEARSQWALEASAPNARRAFEQLGNVRSGSIHSLMVQMGNTEASTLVNGLLTKAAFALERAQISVGELFDEVRGLSEVAPRSAGYDQVTVWLGPDVRQMLAFARVAEKGKAAYDRLDEAVKCLTEAREKVNEAVSQPAADLGDGIRDLDEISRAIRLAVDGEDKTFFHSAQFSRDKRRIGQEGLLSEKLDIGAELAERWLPEMMSVTFTSATIAVADDFKHFNHAVGFDLLPPGRHRALRLASSYNYDEHMQVIVARDLPQPNDPSYLVALEELLFDLHRAMDGSVLTLFTNRREMERLHASLAPRLADIGLDLGMQERGAAGRQVRERFLSDKRASLFALKSFWEGFDAAGETLRCVVIAKLPFASPNDPLSKEREQREDRAWWRYQLPEAVLNVKQAAGRLIRTSSDQGILVLADSRIVSKRYGRQFVKSLPSTNVAELSCAVVPRFVESWREAHEA